MTRMAINADGVLVPLSSLVSNDVALEEKKIQGEKTRKQHPTLDSLLDSQEKESGKCHRLEEKCGLRVGDACSLAAGVPCDLDTELSDIANGHLAAPRPRGGGAPLEIAPYEPKGYVAPSASEIKAKQEKYASRFDGLTVPELKGKCDKLGITYAKNTAKKTLINRIKDFYDPRIEK